MTATLAIILIFILAIAIAVSSHIRAERADERYRRMEEQLTRHYSGLLADQQQTIAKITEKVQSPDARISAALFGEYATIKEEKRQDEIDEEWLENPDSEIPMLDDDLLPVEYE